MHSSWNPGSFQRSLNRLSIIHTHRILGINTDVIHFNKRRADTDLFQ